MAVSMETSLHSKTLETRWPLRSQFALGLVFQTKLNWISGPSKMAPMFHIHAQTGWTLCLQRKGEEINCFCISSAVSSSKTDINWSLRFVRIQVKHLNIVDQVEKKIIMSKRLNWCKSLAVNCCGKRCLCLLKGAISNFFFFIISRNNQGNTVYRTW